VRLDAETAGEHFRKALGHSGDSALRSFLVDPEMADYAALNHTYAAEIALFWRQLAGRPDHKDVFTPLYFETGFRYHSRTSDLLEAITELKEKFRAAWLTEYTPFRLQLALEKYDVECQYWLRVQRRIKHIAETFKTGDAQPPLESVIGE